MKMLLATLLALASSACRMSDPAETSVSERLPTTTTAPDSVRRDESLVPADAPGSIRVVDEPLRDVAGVSNGKTWLLELYQTALADKDALARRLETSERDSTEARGARTALTAERDEAVARATELERRVRELESVSLDLARRLAESEIERLEARKTDLERAAQSGPKERP